MTPIVGVGISSTAPAKAISAGGAMAGATLGSAAAGKETNSAGDAATDAWGPPLNASKFSKNSGKSRRRKAAMGMAAVSPVHTISWFTSWSRCSEAVVFAGWLSNVAPVYLPREMVVWSCGGNANRGGTSRIGERKMLKGRKKPIADGDADSDKQGIP
jgi:hypothetical protein